MGKWSRKYLGVGKNVKGLLVTTATTSAQQIATYTPPSGTSFVIQSIMIEAYLTVVSTTELKLGIIYVYHGGTIFGSYTAINPTSCAPFGFSLSLGDGYEIIGDGATAISIRCTPAVVDSITWIGELIGSLRGK